MTDDLDLAERLESGLGSPPPAPPTERYLTAGRRSLRRRRLAAGAAGVVAVAVVGGTALVSLGGGTPATRGLDPADGPSRTSSADASPSPSSAEDDIELLPDGQLATQPDVEVLRTVADPLDSRRPDRSLGVVYTRDGETTWALATCEVRRDGTTITGEVSDPARKAYARFADWLAFQVAQQDDADGGTVGDPNAPFFGLVELVDGTERLQVVPGSGATILDQRAGVDVGPSFAGPRDRTAAAEIRRPDGERWFALVRESPDGTTDYLPTDGRVGGDSLDEFLDYARAQYSGGEGLR